LSSGKTYPNRFRDSKLLCERESKRTHVGCNAFAMKGKKVCYTHGGATPSGMASPNFIHGRYSKAMPKRLLERFEAAHDDPDLLNLTSEIALVQARIEELVGRLDTAESGAVWRDLRSTWKDLGQAQRSGDKDAVKQYLDDLDTLIKRGYGDHANFQELGTNLELLRRLTESRRKHLLEMDTMVKAEEFGIFLAALRDSLLRHVQDRKILAAIQRDITDLLTRERLSISNNETL